MKNRKGFTLIELMIVIAIIGILAAMAIPNFQKARGSARQKSCYSNIRIISGAIEMYNMDVPTMMLECNDANQAILVTGKYLKKVLVNEPERSCQYSSTGDLTGDGIVTCNYHGSADPLNTTNAGTQI